MLEKITAWLTDARRKKLHAALGSLAVLLVSVGTIDQAQSEAIVGLAGSVLVALQGILGLSLLRASEFAEWFGTVGRGLVYGLAAAAGLVGVVFDLFTQVQVDQWLGILTGALTVVSSFLAVVNVQTVPSTAKA